MTTRVLAALAAAVLATTSPLPYGLSLAPSQAQAQSASVTFENLGFSGEFGSVRIPRISIEGTNATRAEIEALFDPRQAATAWERLRKISATSVSIPLIEIDQKLPEAAMTLVYRDTMMRNVRNGVIGEAVTSMMTMKGTTKAAGKDAKPMPMEMSAANTTIKGYDVSLVLAAIFTGGGGANDPLKVAAAEQSVGRITIKSGDLVNLSIAGIAARDFKMKVLPRPLMDIFMESQKNERDKPQDWQKKNAALMAPILGAIGIGSLEMTGLSSEARESGQKDVVKIGLDKALIAGSTLLPESIRLQGLKVAAQGSNVSLGEFALDRMDFSGLLNTMTKAAETGATPDPVDMVPRIGLFRIGSVDIDVPDVKNAAQRIKAKLGLFETAMSNHIGSIPTALKMTLDRFQMDIPANTKEKGLQDILALGYKTLDVSAGYDIAWQEAQKTLTLSNLNIRSVGMFSANAKAELANVPKELFTTDRAKAAVAALGIVAKSIEVGLVNDSLIEKLIAKQAQEQRRKPDEVRAELAAGATLLVPMMLGDHPAARTLGPILGKFVAEPKNLKVTVTSKDPTGVGATDFIAASNPMDVLKKVDIKAGANE